ncbi:hypothetical protein RRF57_008180 [Xylaria bambusicola]|uniref:Uncharacterized protein n=1 Tax=Xylaria bambusicola TaxID=326684 RepID=A0AAN7ZAU7_9PEZI
MTNLNHRRLEAVMLRDYLARGPSTATERLVAQGADIRSNIAMADKLCSMETYLNQLVKQTKAGDSHGESKTITSAL